MFKYVLKSIREYKKETFLAPLMMIGEVATDVLLPFVMAKILDLGIDKGDMSQIVHYGILLLIITGVSLLFGVLSGRFAAIASDGFAKNLRHDLYYKVQDYSFKNIDKLSTSSLITRMTTDVTNVKNSYQMLIRIAVRAPLMFIFSLMMAFIINKNIAVYFLIAIPFIIGCLIIIAKLAMPLFEKTFKTYDELNNVVKENVGGIRVVKAYVQENNEIKKFDRISTKIYKLFKKAERIVSVNSCVMDFAIYGIILIICYLGTKQIVIGNMTTGELTSLITYATNILMGLMMLSMIYVMLIISMPSLKRINEVFDETSNILTPSNPVTKVLDGSIEFKNVNFSYMDDIDKLALKDINLSIKSGETIGIIGSTGSGKTSLVSLISRLYDATSGEVIVGGKNVKDYDLKVLRDEVSVVLQKNVLFSGTIKENLLWGNKAASDDEINEALRLAGAIDFVNTFEKGINYKLDRGATNVSGGQKQRLCIARALLKNPKIIIFDDSTSACDTVTDSKIRSNLKEYLPNVTKIIIAQRISSVEDADKVIVLDNGVIENFDTPKNLLRKSKIYKEIYDIQKKGDK